MFVPAMILGIFTSLLLDEKLSNSNQENTARMISGATVLAEQKIRLVQALRMDPPEVVRRRHEAERIMAGLPAAERAQQIAKQNAIEARVTYEVDGKIVAIRYRNQTGLFTSNSVRGDWAQLMKEVARRGLNEEMLDDFINAKTEQALRQKYGARLTITRYEADNAPTAGTLHAEIFSDPSAATFATKPPKANLNTEILERLGRVQKSQAARSKSQGNSPRP